MTINQIQDQVIEEFSLLPEWMEKYQYLIDMGRDIPLIDPKLKRDEHLIQGCQSRVWLNAVLEGGRILYTADSDAIITKGIAALMIRVLSGHTPGEILSSELYFIDKTGLREHLSPTRSNGMVSMLKQMKYYALAYQSKTE